MLLFSLVVIVLVLCINTSINTKSGIASMQLGMNIEQAGPD